MRWTPNSTVACIVELDGRFLMVEEQSQGQLLLNQPAGHLEDNELIKEAAVRETLEETGWKVEPEHLVGLYVYRSPNNGVSYHRLCFSAKALEHFPEQSLDKGIVRSLWLTRDEIASQPERLRSPIVLKCIDDYLANQQFPLEFIHE